MSTIETYLTEQRGPGYPDKQAPVVRCDCGSKVECWDAWSNACPTCPREYNSDGSELAPRRFWGEETGERF
jgi:hypothetical protein